MISTQNRLGAECVEVAITLPLLMIAMFSTISITHQWHVEKLLKIATYEAIKVGCAKDGTVEEAEAVFAEHANALGIVNAQLQLNRNQFRNARVGTRLRMRGLAPADRNRIISPVNLSLSEEISGGWVYYRKEGL